ncbi:hypothetical protein B0H13DRAFT_1605742 [Mycena leptocephala]|nr:hypothetical protein B0H13DRAFT_1605742 [Mycena leptocephala]
MRKKYLHDNCDYTFDTLTENMPKSLVSVKVATIWRWEHQMVRWMDVPSRPETKDPQLQVQKFSSTKYKSHQRIPEQVASVFDQ